jgi:hypothetical protein
LFVALLSFPRTVLSLKQSTEPMQVHMSKKRRSDPKIHSEFIGYW